MQNNNLSPSEYANLLRVRPYDSQILQRYDGFGLEDQLKINKGITEYKSKQKRKGNLIGVAQAESWQNNFKGGNLQIATGPGAVQALQAAQLHAEVSGY